MRHKQRIWEFRDAGPLPRRAAIAARLGFLSAFILLSCIGCQKQTQVGEPPSVSTQAQKQSEGPESEAPKVNPQNGDELFELSQLSGSVTEFFENGCKIVPTKYEGDTAYEAAQDYEDPLDIIEVVYDENCTVQIAYSDLQTGTVTYEEASVGDIKKQTRLILYGEYDGDQVLHANQVFLYRHKE